jgi:hypothetical protein
MASRIYCSNLAGELEKWSEKLHRLSGDLERIPSIDKYRVLPQIEQLHIIMTELDDRLCELVDSCEIIDEAGGGREVYGGLDLGGMAGDEKFDYEVGG